jgi:hypothetical protein
MEIMTLAAVVFVVGVGALISALAIDTSRAWKAEAKRLAATNKAVRELHLQLCGALADAEGASEEVQKLRQQLLEERAAASALRGDIKIASRALMREWRLSAELSDQLEELRKQLWHEILTN